MTVRDSIQALQTPDAFDGAMDKLLDMEVEFCTEDSCGLELLSVYDDGDDNKVIVDIG